MVIKKIFKNKKGTELTFSSLVFIILGVIVLIFFILFIKFGLFQIENPFKNIFSAPKNFSGK